MAPLLLFLLFLTFSSSKSKTFWDDKEALKEFKNSIDVKSINPGSCLSSWDFSLDPCDTLFSATFTCGFRCDSVVSGTSRVTELSLDHAGYSGSSLSTVSFNFPYLQILDLSGNYFSGLLPNSLSNLTRLTRLSFAGNSFSGTIPDTVGSLSTLEELLLNDNNLDGSIPESFNRLYSLKRLEIQFNNLSGKFPDLALVKNLNYLDASDNQISGQLPSSLPQSVIQISMRHNLIEGTIPESFKFLNSLQVLDLSFNKLSGSIASLLFIHQTLQQLTLSFNGFTSLESPYYSPLGLPSDLIALDLSNNEIQGALPLFIGLLPKLSALSLENNKFSGMIPTQYIWKTVAPGPDFAPFQRLLLGGNFLFGVVPGPLMALKPGSTNVQLAGNCFSWCPATLFFCQGDEQRSPTECRKFSRIIP